MNIFESMEPRKKRLLIIAGVFCGALIVILTIVAITMSPGQNPTDEYEISDPASEETLTTSGIVGQNSGNILYFGFEELYSYHTENWIEGVKALVNVYTREQNIKLERVSIAKDSYLPAIDQENYKDIFKIILNTNQEELNVEVAYTTDGALVVFFSNGEITYSKEMVYDSRYIRIDGVIPSWLNTGPVIRIRFDDNPPMVSESGLPQILIGEDVRAYFACPLASQTSTDNCYVYKYDLYY